ncbi:MAG: GtrA family protein [Hyphomicrobiales bacterium]|nr:MAG: GtrA family protein [Hyphomicrobiales bacterium]
MAAEPSRFGPRRAFAEPLMFAAVGAESTVFDVSAFWALTLAGLHPIVANVLSYSSVGFLNYCLNARFTFAHRGEASAGVASWRRMAAFAAVKTLALALSTLSLAAALVYLPPLPSKGVSIVVTFAVSFLLSSRLVFVPRSTGSSVS